jgi:hypothetical protein
MYRYCDVKTVLILVWLSSLGCFPEDAQGNAEQAQGNSEQARERLRDTQSLLRYITRKLRPRAGPDLKAAAILICLFLEPPGVG